MDFQNQDDYSVLMISKLLFLACHCYSDGVWWCKIEFMQRHNGIHRETQALPEGFKYFFTHVTPIVELLIWSCSSKYNFKT